MWVDDRRALVLEPPTSYISWDSKTEKESQDPGSWWWVLRTQKLTTLSWTAGDESSLSIWGYDVAGSL